MKSLVPGMVMGMTSEEVKDRILSAEGSGKAGKKDGKKIEKLMRERSAREGMTQLETERKKAADELKERLAAQERELFKKMIAEEEESKLRLKKRNNSGK